jgi:hypothetical protein
MFHKLTTSPFNSMKELGLGLLLIGLVSLVLPLLGLKFMFLSWIEQWGPAVAWGIRGGITLLGLVLWFTFRNRD